MTRGNQRDLARAKNAKKQQDLIKKKGVDEKGANAGLTLEQRRERDANKLREKQAQNSAKNGGASTSGSEEAGKKP